MGDRRPRAFTGANYRLGNRTYGTHGTYGEAMTSMLDWGTYAIEAIGLVILCVWIVVPAREFKRIFKSLKEKESKDDRS